MTYEMRDRRVGEGGATGDQRIDLLVMVKLATMGLARPVGAGPVGEQIASEAATPAGDAPTEAAASAVGSTTVAMVMAETTISEP